MRRVCAVTCALLVGVVASPGIAAAAAGERVVQEAVVSKLAPDGSVLDTLVSQLVQLEAVGGREVSMVIPVTSELESYRNLSGFSGPKGTGDGLEWRTADRIDAQALARSLTDLPLDVRVRYFVDGQEREAEDLKGASGKVTFEVELVNVTGSPSTLVHRGVTSPFLTSTVNAYVPLEYGVRVEFPSERWQRVEGEGVFVQPLGRDRVASASGILSPPVTADRTTVTIDAWSDDVLAPRIQVFAFPKISERVLSSLQDQFDALAALYGGVGSISGSIEAVFQGTVALMDGVEEILTGVGVIDPATGEPVVALDGSGQPTTLLGTIGFVTSTLRDQVMAGIGERDVATGEGVVVRDEKGKTTTLLGSLQSSKDTYDEDLIPGMDQLIAGVDQLAAGIEGGAPQLLDGIDALKDGVSQLVAAVRSGDPNDPGIVEALEKIAGGLGALIVKLDAVLAGEDPGFRQGLQGLAAALDGIQAAAEAGIFLTGDPTGLFAMILGVVTDPPPAGVAGVTPSLLAGLGERNPDGSPKIVLDPVTGEPVDVISALGLMRAGLTDALLPGLEEFRGGLLTVHGGLTDLKGGVRGLIDSVLGALGQMRVGLTNPEFSLPQDALGGRTPKAYLQECPGCFDPTHAAFDAATADPKFRPGFRDVFVLFSEGLKAGIEEFHTNDATNPGLVDGLSLIVGGLDQLAQALHTFDADDPGLVDGLELLRGGLSQVNQGLFAINELGIRTLQGTVGEQGNDAARDRAGLSRRAAEAGKDSVLTGDADLVYTSYVFEIPAQSTAGRDNLARTSAILLALALSGMLAWRPRRG